MVNDLDTKKQIIHIIDFDKNSADNIKNELQHFPIPIDIHTSTKTTVNDFVTDDEPDLLIICFPDKKNKLSSKNLFDKSTPSFMTGPRILCITDNHRDMARLWSFKNGASHLLVKPFTNIELHHHVERLLHSSDVSYQTISSEHAMIHFLKEVQKSGIKEIKPALDPISHYGHFFPDVARIFFKTDRDMDFLEKLAEANLLSRKIYNRVRMCPLCDDNHINIREVCAKCRSIDIIQTEMIHHFACGHVNEISAFKKGTDLICPKCNEVLRHIGLDYEKPTSHFKCNDCEFIFPDPVVEFQCLWCGLVLEINDSIEKLVYRYEISPLGEDAAKTGRISGLDLASLLYNKYTNLYSKQYFEIEFNRELIRQERYKQKFTFLMITIDGLEEVRRKNPNQLVENYVNDIFKTLSSHLRKLDTTCVWDTNMLTVILSGTDTDGAMVVAKRMHEGILNLDHLRSIREPSISISMLSGDETLTSLNDYVEKAISDLNSE